MAFDDDGGNVTQDITGFTGRRRDGGRKKPRPVLVTLLVLLSLVVVAAVVAFGYASNLLNSFNQKAQTIEDVFPSDAPRPERTADNEGAVNFLIIGSDVRGGSGAAEDLPDVPNGGRSDTMMLVNIPGDRQSMNVMSIMRDTWVEIPGRGEHKINAALAFGGIPLLVQTIEGIVDAPVDHVAVIDFEGFKGLTTALGGVEVKNPQAFRSTGSEGEVFPEGKITLEGQSALKFVRERKQFGDGDYSRVANQQLFLKAVMAKFLTAETLTNPAKISEVVDTFAPYLSVDEGFNGVTAAQLGIGLRDVRTSNVHTFTLPNLGTGRSVDGQSIVVSDPAAVQEVAAAIGTDTLTEYVEAEGLEN